LTMHQVDLNFSCNQVSGSTSKPDPNLPNF